MIRLPLIRLHASGNVADLVDDYATSIVADGSNWLIQIPRGFLTDFASVPRMLWGLYPPIADYWPAAIIHDWLYAQGSPDRETCDAIFLAAMKACGVSSFKAWAIYKAVRLFGGAAWAAHRARETRPAQS